MSKIYNYKTKIERNPKEYGESIEEKMRRVMLAGEPIEDGAPLIYTEFKDGVQPQYDIRTDRWDVALDAMDKVNKSQIAQRDNLIAKKEEINNEQKTE